MGDVVSGISSLFGSANAPSTWGGASYLGGNYSIPGAVAAPSALSNIASVAKPLLPFAALMGSNYLQGQQAQKTSREAAQANQQTWQQNAYPRPEAINAAATENRGQLGQARLQSYQNLASNLASRGWGSGSGVMAGGAKNIERGYLQTLGKQATDMTKLANTPMFGMPSAAYQTPVSGGPQQALGSLDSALGYYMMMNALGR